MSLHKNKANFAAIPEEVFNKGNLAAIEELFTSAYTDHTPLPPGFPSGLAGVYAFVTMLREAFPDLHYTLDDAIAEGDKVVGRVTVTGTNTGPFMGMPATGKRATWTEIHVGRMVRS